MLKGSKKKRLTILKWKNGWNMYIEQQSNFTFTVGYSCHNMHESNCTFQMDNSIEWNHLLYVMLSDEYHFVSCVNSVNSPGMFKQQHWYDICDRKWLLLVSTVCNDWFYKCVRHEINRFPLMWADFFHRHFMLAHFPPVFRYS